MPLNMKSTLALALAGLAAGSPAMGAGLPLPAMAGCTSAARLPPNAVYFGPIPARAAGAYVEPRLDPATTVFQLFAQRDELRRRYKAAGVPFKSDVCGEGKNRLACLDALLEVERAVEAQAVNDTKFHRAMRELYLDGGEGRLDAGTRGRLQALLATWMKGHHEGLQKSKKATGHYVCIFPAKDEVDKLYIRVFTRQAVGDHHMVGAYAILNMRFGPRFAPNWRPGHPPVPRYC